ncbi:antitoxin [Enterococcus sp. DIV0240a]|uniref:antitoxin n=1 Tax=unclassified Enterococcus TaxID=2608891 RepID=UPI003D2D5721
MNTDNSKEVQDYVAKLQREIDDLKQSKAVMVNETAKETIDLYIQNLEREIRRLEALRN